jgi:hypothetical protein
MPSAIFSTKPMKDSGSLTVSDIDLLIDVVGQNFFGKRYTPAFSLRV